MDNSISGTNGPSKRTRGARQKGVDTVTKKFLHNFDPEQSEREKRKLNRRLHHGNRKTVLYDEKGIYIPSREDLCDCLQKSCMGCHFPCPKCSSTKCGHECRNNRKWMYDSIENEGSDNVIKNQYNTNQ
ncbi:PREDICTED: ARL14 effector protein [Ceratosolen solmsi marchali]|uniref:ARL14 effector protein n=1 Tax=Ceratosolen solmsi marchali TaxID=326594 RepID=A0AAJ7DYQ1_9HYME|nr:PREDICTED: ARL14 effector protein [Ceratosolen solmsi marchali]